MWSLEIYHKPSYSRVSTIHKCCFLQDTPSTDNRERRPRSFIPLFPWQMPKSPSCLPKWNHACLSLKYSIQWKRVRIIDRNFFRMRNFFKCFSWKRGPWCDSSRRLICWMDYSTTKTGQSFQLMYICYLLFGWLLFLPCRFAGTKIS